MSWLFLFSSDFEVFVEVLTQWVHTGPLNSKIVYCKFWSSRHLHQESLVQLNKIHRLAAMPPTSAKLDVQMLDVEYHTNSVLQSIKHRSQINPKPI